MPPKQVTHCPHCEEPMQVYDDLPSALAELKRSPGCRLRFIITEPEEVTAHNAERERARGCFELLAERYGRKCLNCEQAHKLLVDHIIPLSRDGTSDIENLQILCKRCNLRKGITTNTEADQRAEPGAAKRRPEPTPGSKEFQEQTRNRYRRRPRRGAIGPGSARSTGKAAEPNQMSNQTTADDNFRRPNVRRDSLPPAEKELILYADDSPARPGNTPQIGDQDWTMKIPLHDGTRLNLHMGRASHANFTAMLAAEATDDAEEQLK